MDTPIPKPAPRAVIFDLGKVLLDFDWQVAVRQLLPRVRLPVTVIQAVLNGSTLLHDYESGRLTTPEFFAQIRDRVGFVGTLDDFAAGFGDIFTAMPEMIALHAEVRQRGFRTFIFSNTNELAIDVVRARFPFFRDFDGWFLSYEQRAMKPAPESYARMEQLAGARGAELFYLDDRPENVEGGWARGWQGVIHQTEAQSRRALVAAGVLP